MRVLGIETSCDETGIAIFCERNGLLAHRVHSQIDVHAYYGGVVPELASRDHVRYLRPLWMKHSKPPVFSYLRSMPLPTPPAQGFSVLFSSEPLLLNRWHCRWVGRHSECIIWRDIYWHH